MFNEYLLKRQSTVLAKHKPEIALDLIIPYTIPYYNIALFILLV